MSCLSREQMRRMMDAVNGYCGPSPDPVKVHTISHTVERFCKDIGGIQLHLGPVQLNRENGIYFAVAPFGGVVTDVKSVAVNGDPIVIGAYKVFYRDDGRASVTIPYGKRENSFLEMDVFWRPGERTTQMPDNWFDKNFDAIMHGSIAAILSQVGTAWGNPQLAQQFEAEYARDVHDCIYDARATQNPNGQISALDPMAHWL